MKLFENKQGQARKLGGMLRDIVFALIGIIIFFFVFTAGFVAGLTVFIKFLAAAFVALLVLGVLRNFIKGLIK